MRSLARGSAQADRVEGSLRSHPEVNAQTRAPLDRQAIEPVVVEEFVRMSIRVHAVTFFR
jgi:hypothetical protein